ncbi:MAG: hypothetical protein H7X99_03090 [Saprospiraceae bacterium]|nr:hypothetical protein [Saprospiraceae bacterium]
MQKIITFIGCLFLCFELVHLNAQTACDSLMLFDFTYKQARDIRITNDIIFYRKCNDTSSHEIKIASKAIMAVIIDGKMINLEPETRTRWTFTRNSDEKRISIFKGDKIELKLSKELKQKKIKGILQNISNDSIYVVGKKKGVIAISKLSIATIKFSKSGSRAEIIALVSVLFISGGLLFFLWLSTRDFFSRIRDDGNEAIPGYVMIILGMSGIISLFFLKKDPEIKDPFSGKWKIEHNINESEP